MKRCKLHTGLRWLCYIVPAILAAMIVSCGDKPIPAPTVARTCITDEMDSLLLSVFGEDNAPGAVVIVTKGDSTYYNRGFGLARLDNPTPMTDSTILNISSATKTFTTTAIMRLVNAGKLSLDDPMIKYFPNFNPDVFGKITLRHVLSLTTGLADYRPRTPEQWAEFVATHRTAFATKADFVRYGRENEQVQIFSSINTLRHEPGTVFEYEDAPYMLLSFIIEKVTGMPFEDWMQRNIFNRAGLHETSFVSPQMHDPRMAHAYRKAQGNQQWGVFRSADGKWDEYDYGEVEYFLTRADNGIYSTPREFVKWMHALYGGKVVPRALVDSANTPVVYTGLGNINYGLGLYTCRGEDMPRKKFHSSSNGGFGVYEAVFPEIELSYLVFANRADWNRLELADRIDAILRAHNWLQPH